MKPNRLDFRPIWRFQWLTIIAITLIPAITAAITTAPSPAATNSATNSANSTESIHPVSIVEADIYVTRFKTTMRLTCFAEDLEMLQGVEALEDGRYDSDELLDATKDHAKYLAEKVTIRNAQGELMTPKITEIINIEIPDDGIKAGMLMNYTMGFVLEFSYDEPPQFITLQQDMVADGALLPSEMSVILKQAGSGTPYDTIMMKPSEPQTFRFDWDSPPLSQEASEQEWAAWSESQRQKTLGIRSYSSVYSFIYITAHEVRHEVLIPLATLATLMEIDRADESFLEIEEQAAAAEKIKAFFSIGNPVKIDSVEVQPVFDRIDFYGLDLRDFAVQAEKRKVSMASGRVGIIMSYSTKGAPTKVEVSWDKFNDQIKSVDAVVFAYDKIEKTQFSMFLENNTFEWSEPDRKPLPKITDVSSTIDLESLKPAKLKFSILSAGLIVVTLLTLLAGLAGLNWKTAIIVASVCGIGSIVSIGLLQMEFNNPFAPRPEFAMPEDDAEQIFAQLHKNMFRAFDYHDESDVYDALANSVDGPLLNELYLKINESLKVQEQGGAVAHVQEVNLLDGHGSELEQNLESESDALGFKYHCTWNLIGTIEHWGHIHQRENEFVADFKVQLRDDAWKITEMKVTNEKQGVVKTDVRKFE